MACTVHRIISSYSLAHFYLMKKMSKILRNPFSAPVCKKENRHPNLKCIVPAFFGAGKDAGLRTHNPYAEEARRFLY
jgi:hypothetical protein